jgi:hypothetical protein
MQLKVIITQCIMAEQQNQELTHSRFSLKYFEHFFVYYIRT